MKKVLVTGGGGFIGSYVVDKLLDFDYDVMVLDHTSNHYYDPHPRIEHFLGDIRDATAVTEAAAHVDGIIHLAAVLGTQETIGNPRPAAETNILGSLNVFEAANQYGLPVVYAGVGNHWMREYGGGTYTISKTCVEDFAKMFNNHRGGRISVVRPVNAYGPRQSIAAPFGTSKVRKILPSFTCRALLGEPIEIYGDGTQISDCVYVEDVASTFVRTLISTDSIGPVTDIEVGPEQSSTVNEIAQMVRMNAMFYTDRASEIVHLNMRPGEVPNAVVKADTESCWKVGVDPSEFVSLSEGIRRTVEWYYNNWYPEYIGVELFS